jgi:hypothetical protein
MLLASLPEVWATSRQRSLDPSPGNYYAKTWIARPAVCRDKAPPLQPRHELASLRLRWQAGLRSISILLEHELGQESRL